MTEKWKETSPVDLDEGIVKTVAKMGDYVSMGESLIYDPFSSVKWRGSRLTVKRFLYGFGTVQPGDFIENSGFL